MKSCNMKVKIIIKIVLLIIPTVLGACLIAVMLFPIVHGLIQGDPIIVESGLIFLSLVCALFMFFMLQQSFIAWRFNKKRKANECASASEKK